MYILGYGQKKSAGPGPLALFFGLGPGSRAQCGSALGGGGFQTILKTDIFPN